MRHKRTYTEFQGWATSIAHDYIIWMQSQGIHNVHNALLKESPFTISVNATMLGYECSIADAASMVVWVMATQFNWHYDDFYDASTVFIYSLLSADIFPMLVQDDNFILSMIVLYEKIVSSNKHNQVAMQCMLMFKTIDACMPNFWKAFFKRHANLLYSIDFQNFVGWLQAHCGNQDVQNMVLDACQRKMHLN